MSNLTCPFSNLFGRSDGNIVDEDEDRVIETPLRVENPDIVGEVETPRDNKSQTDRGPLMFRVLIEKVINLSELATESITSHVKKYILQTVIGEDVELVCRKLRFALKQLDNMAYLTSDIISSIYNVFKTSSDEEFSELYHLWKQPLELCGIM